MCVEDVCLDGIEELEVVAGAADDELFIPQGDG